jgi:hypothetical protein
MLPYFLIGGTPLDEKLNILWPVPNILLGFDYAGLPVSPGNGSFLAKILFLEKIPSPLLAVNNPIPFPKIEEVWFGKRLKVSFFYYFF